MPNLHKFYWDEEPQKPEQYDKVVRESPSLLSMTPTELDEFYEDFVRENSTGDFNDKFCDLQEVVHYLTHVQEFIPDQQF